MERRTKRTGERRPAKDKQESEAGQNSNSGPLGSKTSVEEVTGVRRVPKGPGETQGTGVLRFTEPLRCCPNGEKQKGFLRFFTFTRI